MNEQLQKGLDLLISHSQDTMALEQLVAAMEACLEGGQYDGSGVDGSGLVEAPAQPKHPLEDYQITEKDIGSLVTAWDDGSHTSSNIHAKLVGLERWNQFEYHLGFGSWQRAKPYLDPIALHFIPYYATETSVAPDDLGEHFAVLWNDGDVTVYNDTESFDEWQNYNDDYEYVVGYRPLKFVNPLNQDK